MKLIIAGSRDIINGVHLLNGILKFGLCNKNISEIVSGRCKGVDLLGEDFATFHKIPIKSFPVKWKLPNGKTDYEAGKKRNVLMAYYADALLAVWDGKSSGTRHMIKTMRTLGKPYWVHIIT